MALIKCKECGHEVSDRASACPNCGCPIASEQPEAQNDVIEAEPVYYEEEETSNKWLYVIIGVLVAIIIMGGIYGYSKGYFFGGGGGADSLLTDSMQVDTVATDSAAVEASDDAAVDSVSWIVDEQEVEEERPAWLQGTWTTRVRIMGETKTAKLVIDGTRATFYSDGSALDSGNFEIRDGEIHFGSTHVKIDEARQRIMFDDNTYFEHSSRPSGEAVSITSPSQDREMRIMARLHELGTKGQSLVSELAMMRRSGQMDPARYMYIKQALLQYKDEQIQLARQLGDDDLEREYRQQKDGVMESFRMIENGY